MQIITNVLQDSKQVYTSIYIFEFEENLVNVAESICKAEIRCSLKELLPNIYGTVCMFSTNIMFLEITIVLFWYCSHRWKKYAAFTQVFKQSVLPEFTTVLYDSNNSDLAYLQWIVVARTCTRNEFSFLEELNIHKPDCKHKTFSHGRKGKTEHLKVFSNINLLVRRVELNF
jgi:hypothetical protein